MRVRIGIGIGAAVVALAMAAPAEAAKPLKVKLRFSPQENVTAVVPNVDQASTTRPIQVVALADERALEDKALIGANRESSTPVPVYALSSVADFATETLRTCLLGCVSLVRMRKYSASRVVIEAVASKGAAALGLK